MSAEQTTFLNIFGEGLDPTNRWMVLKDLVPWDELELALSELAPEDRSPAGRPPLPARVALGALIIKEALGLTDRETVAQIQENPYLQSFLGFASFSSAKPFDASSMVHFRKRLDADLVGALNRLVVESFHGRSAGESEDSASEGDDDGSGSGSTIGSDGGAQAGGSSSSRNGGTLMLDATCAPADITHPDDLGLLNHAREITERVIDRCHATASSPGAKPRTYRQKARRAFLRAAKRKRSTPAQRRRAKREQLQYIRRNLGHIDRLVASGGWDLSACSRVLRERLETVRVVYDQQWEMYTSGAKSVPNRIYNIAQPHVRAIRRSKPGRKFEWGAKISSYQ